MSIISYNFGTAGTEGIEPRKVCIKCDDTLSQITTQNHFYILTQNGNYFTPTDEVHINYGTNSASFGIFTPTISGSNVTMTQNVEGVTTPVVSGNIPKFSGTGGLMVDSGISPSNAAKTKMIMANGATVVGNFGKFADTSGTLADAAMSPSNAAKTKVCMADAATVINNLLMATDTVGTVGDSGINLKFGITASWGGGSAVHTYMATGLTASYSGLGMLIASGNVVGVAYAVPGTDNITVTFTGDPGAGAVVFWIAIKTS
jgi:hypothetical protein